jgi:hypothetical protein
VADPVLLLHQIQDGIFELSGLRTISIRDQMLRAYLLVNRCIDAKLIASDRPLLVIGGGIGGVIATMTAAENGIPVVLVEEQPSLFWRQLVCDRHLDPTEYDWPAEHWAAATYPFPIAAVSALAAPPPPRPSMPLRYLAAPANVLAARWTREFALWRTTPNARFATVATGLGPVIPAVHIVTGTGSNQVFLNHPSPKLPAPSIGFGAAISCVGFPREQTTVSHTPPRPGKYTGFDFWGPDPHVRRNLGISGALPSPLRVLISGSGDGALQDFIRVLTGRSAGWVYQQIFGARPSAPNLPGTARWPDLLPYARADDLARRACAYSMEDGHHTLQTWHDVYMQEINVLWHTRLRGNVLGLANSLLRNDVRDLDVLLVHRCRHFGFCYGLNRFIAVLLAHLHADMRERSLEWVLRHGYGVVAVDPERPGGASPHAHPGLACGDPRICHGKPHWVSVQGADCSGTIAGARVVTIDVPFHSVIIRHGVERKPFFGHAPFPRQNPPYHELL